MDHTIPLPTSLEGRVYRKINLKDHTLDEIDLEHTCPLDLGRHRIEPEHDLGLLESLPLEIISDILVQLPVRTLMDFRRINQRAMEVIGSIPQFQAITRHALSLLRGILSIQAGLHVTFKDLFHALTRSRCEECDDFAGYIYLLDCSRVCFMCFSEKQRYLPLSPAEVLRTYGLNRRALRSLVSMRSVPGCYSPNGKSTPSSLQLFDSESARRTGVSLYGSAEAMARHISQVAMEKLESRCSRPNQRAQGILATTPLGGAPRLAFAKRFMAIVRIPTLNSLTGTIEWGFHCVGCERQHRRRPLHWRRKFTMDTFEHHMQQCGPIVNQEHLSNSVYHSIQ